MDRQAASGLRLRLRLLLQPLDLISPVVVVVVSAVLKVNRPPRADSAVVVYFNAAVEFRVMSHQQWSGSSGSGSKVKEERKKELPARSYSIVLLLWVGHCDSLAIRGAPLRAPEQQQ